MKNENKNEKYHGVIDVLLDITSREI